LLIRLISIVIELDNPLTSIDNVLDFLNMKQQVRKPYLISLL